MTSSRSRRAAACFVVLSVVAAPAAAQKRGITEKDLFKFVWVADPQISPDGSQVAFVRVTVDEKKDQYDSGIWVARADGSEGPRKLTGGTRDTGPRWSPDGKRLAFVRSVEKEGRPQPPQVFVIAMDGGEARAITEMPRGAGNPQWSPDGKTIAFSSTARPSELKKEKEEEKPGEKKQKTSRVRATCA
jgi:dipeptidyl aminopeptidase/acylaminoacyl peptidase